MASYTIEQHVQMIKLYYQNECSLVRTLRPFYGRRGGPSKSTLQRLVAKFETTGSVNNQPTPVRRRNARSAMNIAGGIISHTADATMDILHERFQGMVISRRGDVNWPPRSCNLTPLDLFLWCFLKLQVYANKPQSTDVLKVNITNAITQIQPDLCGRAIENWTTRIRATVRSRGGHLNDVIFHT